MDYITLTAHLSENGVNQCGGVVYVTSLTDGAASREETLFPRHFEQSRSNSDGASRS